MEAISSCAFSLFNVNPNPAALSGPLVPTWKAGKLAQGALGENLGAHGQYIQEVFRESLGGAQHAYRRTGIEDSTNRLSWNISWSANAQQMQLMAKDLTRLQRMRKVERDASSGHYKYQSMIDKQLSLYVSQEQQWDLFKVSCQSSTLILIAGLDFYSQQIDGLDQLEASLSGDVTQQHAALNMLLSVIFVHLFSQTPDIRLQPRSHPSLQASAMKTPFGWRLRLEEHFERPDAEAQFNSKLVGLVCEAAEDIDFDASFEV